MRLTVKTKLAAAFGLVILLSAVAGAVAYLKLNDLATTTEVLTGAAGRQDKAAQLKELMLLQIRAEKNAHLASAEADVERYTNDVRDLRVKLLKTKDDVYATATETGKKLLDRFVAAYAQMNNAQDQALKIAKTDRAKGVEVSTTEVRKSVGEAGAILDEYVAFLRKLMADRSDEAKQEGARAEMIVVSLVLVSLLVAIAAAVLIALNISRGLGRAVNLANAVAIGDLGQTIEASSDDEVGDLIKALTAMTANLNATAAVAGEVAQGNLDVVARPLSDKDTLGLALQKMLASLNATAAVADEIAQGNLTVEAKRITDKDKLGIALERMVEKLRQVVSEALTAAQNVSAGSQELSASAEQLSQGATEQA
ncbi:MULTISPECIES: HAMP domain-containing protein, partial [unclassified Bradyrhizobium]